MVRRTFIQEGSVRRRDRLALENTYYDAIYDLVTGDANQEMKAVKLKQLKAKITRLHNKDNKRIFLDNHYLDVVDGEGPSIYRIIRAMKRQDMRMILNIRDCNGITHTSPAGIIKTFTDFIGFKYNAEWMMKALSN
jgi:hypothetical protein